MKIMIRLIALMFVTVATVAAQGPPNRPPNDNADGPWNRDVIAYRVSRSGAVEKVATFERAGVPTIARMNDGRLIVAHQHFPADDRESFDKVAVHFSSDDGVTWGAAQVIRVDGLPEGMRFPFDPTLVPLPDGRVRLYFTGNMGRGFGASTPAIHSAISADGVTYTYEPGARFAVEGRAVIDCAVVLHRGVFHLFAPDNGAGPNPAQNRPREGAGYHATSTDGLAFTRVDDVQMEGRRNWLGNAQSDGERITFFGTGAGVWTATSEDGAHWTLAEPLPIRGGDPGAVRTLDGGLLVVITGEPVRGGPRRDAGAQPPVERRRDGQLPGDGGAPPTSTAEAVAKMWSQGRATGKGPVKLQSFPLRVEDIGHIIPLGNMQSGHVTPSDHLYLVPIGAVNRGQQRPGVDNRDFSQLYDVVAVADGFVVMLQWRPNPPGGQAKYDPSVFDRAVDLKVFIEHAATCWSYVDHLIEVDAAIMSQVPGGVQPGQPVHVRIPVKAGQVIGKIGNQTFDFALIDTTTMRSGFVKPERFLHRDPQKPHVVDPFDYIDEPLRTQLLAKCARKVPPFGGRIDYDIDGKLIGNWYEEGTGGSAGLNRRIDYWVSHLSIVPHHLDPMIIVVSIGNYDGRAAQFWVKGNAPDPALIREQDGIVKYELMHGQLGSTGQLQRRADAEEVQGVALAQVLPDRRLRFETFPGRTAAQVRGFTTAARFYER